MKTPFSRSASRIPCSLSLSLCLSCAHRQCELCKQISETTHNIMLRLLVVAAHRSQQPLAKWTFVNFLSFERHLRLVAFARVLFVSVCIRRIVFLIKYGQRHSGLGTTENHPYDDSQRACVFCADSILLQIHKQSNREREQERVCNAKRRRCRVFGRILDFSPNSFIRTKATPHKWCR